jgi:dienelactone hydrolase
VIRAALLACLVLCASAASAADRIKITIPIWSGQPGVLEAVLYRPDGDGPWPLAVINHGAPRMADYAARMRPGFDDMARLLVAHGYAVVVPMRRGYGRSSGPRAEGYRSCENPDFAKSARATADDILDVVAHMKTDRSVRADRVLLLGYSAGGFGALAVASRNPAGLMGVVNISGGRGSLGGNRNCAPDRLIALIGAFGRTTRVPTLWIYSLNDTAFGPDLARAMYDAFVAGGAPRAEFVQAPAWGDEGHYMVFYAPEIWMPIVERFLAKLGD